MFDWSARKPIRFKRLFISTGNGIGSIYAIEQMYSYSLQTAIISYNKMNKISKNSHGILSFNLWLFVLNLQHYEYVKCV